MTTIDRLKQLKQVINDARPVPMSSSCMVNRVDAIAMIDAALAELPGEHDEAKAVIAARDAERLRGKDEGDRIRIEAEEWAQATANQTEIVRRAEIRANELITAATQESEALRAETHAYVDQRMAEFEAALQQTESQVKIMRGRLMSRQEAAEEPTPLPEI